jgi:hypothetical protein
VSRPRRYGHDYAYGLQHFERFPEQYKRLSHRFAMADVDWTEFCGYERCRKPLMLVEMFRDSERGIDLSDKGVSVVRQLAKGVGAAAYVMAYFAIRPRGVQTEIDALNRRVLDLTRQWPITRLRAQRLDPKRGRVFTYTPDEWWELVALSHSEHHHHGCSWARRSSEQLANPAWLAAAQGRQALWVPPQQELPFNSGVA